MESYGQRYLRLGVLLISAVLLVLSILRFYNVETSFGAQLSQKQIDLQNVLDEIDMKTASSGVDVSVLEHESEVSLASARIAGEKVATFENELLNLVVNYDGSLGDSELDHNSKVDKIMANLDSCFGGKLNHRAEWYIGDIVEPKSAYPYGRWVFCTNYSFDGDNIPVLWKFVDSYGHIYAYATAMYDVKTNTFANDQVYRTIYGNGAWAFDNDSGYLSTDDDIMTSIQSLWDAPVSENYVYLEPMGDEPDEVESNLAEAREWARQTYGD